MRFDLPVCKRCCLCVPLRHGILVFGYLNLSFSLFLIGMMISLEFREGRSTSHLVFMFRGVPLHTHIWFPYLVYAMEAVFNVLLLVGAHRKHMPTIRAYYYYGITTTIAAFLTLLVVIRLHSWQAWYHHPLDICVVFCGLALQCYLLLVIRSELIKLRYQGEQFRYVNHMAEVVVSPATPGEGGNPI